MAIERAQLLSRRGSHPPCLGKLDKVSDYYVENELMWQCVRVGALGMAIAFATAPAAIAGKIVIPVQQTQSAVQVGDLEQQAGGGNGSTSQTGILEQQIDQTQILNINVPDDFRGNIRVQPESGSRGGRSGRGGGRRGNGADPCLRGNGRQIGLDCGF
ncbi:hypothetical protein [Synechococcus sp. PCC 7336]|uniref:hypothetical protein n=1 Tax=Synechococcus sp. PCC 7336 TaxID=195250 RepID=UPI00035E31E1|nr:hypothetical protein [Synechococcus sp. PCC 7336]